MTPRRIHLSVDRSAGFIAHRLAAARVAPRGRFLFAAPVFAAPVFAALVLAGLPLVLSESGGLATVRAQPADSPPAQAKAASAESPAASDAPSRLARTYAALQTYQSRVRLAIEHKRPRYSRIDRTDAFVALDRPNERLLVDAADWTLAVQGRTLQFVHAQLPGMHLETRIATPLRFWRLSRDVPPLRELPLPDLLLLIDNQPWTTLLNGSIRDARPADAKTVIRAITALSQKAAPASARAWRADVAGQTVQAIETTGGAVGADRRSTGAEAEADSRSHSDSTAGAQAEPDARAARTDEASSSSSQASASPAEEGPGPVLRALITEQPTPDGQMTLRRQFVFENVTIGEPIPAQRFDLVTEGSTAYESFNEMVQAFRAQQQTAQTGEAERRVGGTFPDVSLERLHASADQPERVGLADLKGKVAVLDFWATWCPPCLQVLPEFERVAAARADDDRVALFAVNVNETDEQVRRLMDHKGWSFPVLMDRDGKLASAAGVKVFPTTFILVDGEVKDVSFGAHPQYGDYLRKQIAEGLASLPDGAPDGAPDGSSEAGGSSESTGRQASAPSADSPDGR